MTQAEDASGHNLSEDELKEAAERVQNLDERWTEALLEQTAAAAAAAATADDSSGGGGGASGGGGGGLVDGTRKLKMHVEKIRDPSGLSVDALTEELDEILFLVELTHHAVGSFFVCLLFLCILWLSVVCLIDYFGWLPLWIPRGSSECMFVGSCVVDWRCSTQPFFRWFLFTHVGNAQHQPDLAQVLFS